MKTRIVVGAALLVGAFALTQASAAPPKGRPAETVRIGLVSSLARDTPPALLQVVMRPFKALMETETGMAGELVVGGDALALGQQLKEDKVQVGVFHGVEFAWARLKYPTLKPLAIAVNRHKVLHASLVVRADSKASSPAALEGQAVALPALTREHCRLFLARRCVKAGTTPDKFYSKLTKPADEEAALDDVVDGKVQGAVIDDVALEAYKKAKPGRGKRLRTLLRSETFPCAVIAYQPGRFDDKALANFKAGLLAARTNKRGKAMLDMLRITGFEAVPADYDRLFAEIAKAYPPPP